MDKIGVQLIVYGGRERVDLSAVLAEVREVGFAGVETGVLYPELGQEKILKALQQTGLALTGMHTGYADIAQEEKVRAHIAFLQEAGSRFLICSGVADNNSLAGYEEAADIFNRVGALCQDAGVTFCYHNHAWEFKPLEGGRQGIYRLIELTDPALVKLNVDVFWVHIGGENPADFIRRHANRVGYYHFKDGKKTADGQIFLELGQGEVDLAAAAQEAQQHPLEWIVCEQDRTELTAKESIRQSLAYLKSLGL